MSAADFKLFDIGPDGEPDFSNAGPLPPPSRERALEALQRWRETLSTQPEMLADAPVISPAMLAEGLRDGWIERDEGGYVFRAVAGLPLALLPYARSKA